MARLQANDLGTGVQKQTVKIRVNLNQIAKFDIAIIAYRSIRFLR